MHRRTLGIAGTALLALGCGSEAPTAPRTGFPVAPEASALFNGQAGLAWGNGQAILSVGPMDVAFVAFGATQGRAGGWFRHYIPTSTGTIEFTAVVTCISVDEALGRAWIGGKVLTNKSTRTDFTTAVHQPGDEIWFRVLDGGWRAGDPPDRSTSPGFEGALGVITSREYCDKRLWPNEPPALSTGRVDVH
jgi:hypothetical protein